MEDIDKITQIIRESENACMIEKNIIGFIEFRRNRQAFLENLVNRKILTMDQLRSLQTTAIGFDYIDIAVDISGIFFGKTGNYPEEVRIMLLYFDVCSKYPKQFAKSIHRAKGLVKLYRSVCSSNFWLMSQIDETEKRLHNITK
jgi:hypothetical protein